MLVAVANPGRLVADLTVVGESVDPDEIRELLRASPDRSHKVGDLVSPKRSSVARRRSGLWSISTRGRLDESASLSDHIRDLLQRVTSDAEVWGMLAHRHSTRVFVGWFMALFNEGAGIEPDVLAELGRLSLLLDFDVYSSSPDEQAEEVRQG